MTLEELIGAQFPGVGTTAPPPTQLATLQAMFPGRVGNQAVQQSMYLNQRPQNSSQGFPPRVPGTQSPLATPPGRQPINTPIGQTPGNQTQQRTGTTATSQPFATYTGNESGPQAGSTTTTTGGGNALQSLLGLGGLGYGAYKAYPAVSRFLGLDAGGTPNIMSLGGPSLGSTGLDAATGAGSNNFASGHQFGSGQNLPTSNQTVGDLTGRSDVLGGAGSDTLGGGALGGLGGGALRFLGNGLDVVGAPGASAFGNAGYQIGSGFNLPTGSQTLGELTGASGAASKAGSLGKGTDLLGKSNIFDTGSQLGNTGLNIGFDVLGGILGNKLGGALGSNRMGGMAGSPIGSLVGSALIPIPGVGAFVGATLGKLLGGLFGAHPTTGPMSDATLTYGEGGYDLKPTQIDPGIRAGGKSQAVIDQLKQATDPLGQSVKDTFAQYVEDIGGGLAGFDNVTVGTKYDKGSKGQKYYGGLQSDYLGGKPQLFDSPDQAIANAIYTALNSAKFGEGSDPNKLNQYKSQLYAMAFPQQAQPASVSPDLSALMGIAA